MIALLLTIAVVVICYSLFIKPTSKGPPGPLCLPLIGSAWAFGNDMPHLHVTLTKLAKKWGPIYKIMIARKPVVVISDVELLKEALGGADPPVLLRFVENTAARMDKIGRSIFLSGDRDHWAMLRKACAPMIRNMPGGVPIPKVISHEVSLLIAEMDKHTTMGVHLNPIFMIFTRNVFLQIFIRERWEYKLQEDQIQFVENIFAVLEILTSVFNFIPALDFLRIPARNEIDRRLVTVDTFLKKIIDKRLEEAPITEETARDLLDILILEMRENPALTMGSVITTLRMLFIAGSATVADSLDWMVLFLCTYPEIQEKCHQEIKEKLKGRLPTMEDQENLPYLDGVIKETFRLRPPAPLAVMRVAERDCTIGGHHIEKDSVVIPNLYGIGNTDKYYDNPSTFDPERWIRNPELAANLVHFAIGPTICLGMPIAKQESFLAAATLIQKYKFSIAPNSPVPDFVGEFKIVYNPSKWLTSISLR